MVLGKLLEASYKGIQFHIEEASDEITWNHQTSEYITGEAASTIRFSKAARTFQVRGFLLGRDANLTKDFLIAATDEKNPGKLIHPLYGVKNAVCVSRRLITLGVSAFQLQMDFKEADDDSEKSLIDDASSKLDQVKDAINQAGLEFYKQMAVVLEANHLLNEAVKTIEKIDSIVESANGLAIVPRAAGSFVYSTDRTLAMIRKPKILYSAMGQSAASVVKKGLISRLGDLTAGEGSNLIRATFMGLILAEASKSEGQLDMESYGPLTDFFTDKTALSGRKPILKTLFPIVWEVQQRLVKTPAKMKSQGKPSLVAAFEQYGDLGRERELAYEAGQPFRV